MKTILVIDDQRINLITIEAIIKSNIPDCMVLTALLGKEGIEIAIKNQPDIIILDIVMPEIDGYEVCKRLKENELTKRIPIMMITSNETDTESRVRGLNLGADAFLSRPIDFIELSTQVKVMLRIKEAEEELQQERDLLEQKVKERTKELSKSEKELKAALKKATESDRLKLAFLATMSHELRTPLNAVIGLSDIINEDLPIKDIIEYNRIINTSGQCLLNIIEDILDITMIETGGTKVYKSIFSLNGLIGEVHDFIETEQHQANKIGIDLKHIKSSKNKDIAINTDPAKLKQILINLLRNAFKFTDTGHIHYGYDVVQNNGTPLLKFFVEDTGIGIAEKKQPIIFEVFRQVEDSHTRTRGGTGIGLTISKKLIELLDGEIGFESTEGKGSTFYFTIPYEGYETAKKKKKKEKIDRPEVENAIKNKTVLIVEDVEASFHFLNAVLLKSRINTVWAKDGADAVKLCKENSIIDLVLMDISMPVMNGYDATKRIKKINPGLPIIAQTAYAIEGDRKKALDAGCDDYITKPINKEHLLDLIDKYIQTDSD